MLYTARLGFVQEEIVEYSRSIIRARDYVLTIESVEEPTGNVSFRRGFPYQRKKRINRGVTGKVTAYDQYFQEITALLEKIKSAERESITKAAQLMADSIRNNGLIRIFDGPFPYDWGRCVLPGRRARAGAPNI